MPASLSARVIAFDKAADELLDNLRGKRAADRLFYGASEVGDMALAWHIIAVARGLRSERDAADAVRVSMILGAESILVNGIIKSFFRRTRPAWDQPRVFRIRKPLSSSFPSGHASSAFTAAAVLSEDDPLAPLYYAAAIIIATSRAYVRIHHASDVVAGVATGVVLGRLARKVWPKPINGNPFSGLEARHGR